MTHVAILNRAFLLLALAGIGCSSTSEPGALVPPTADQDPALPRVRVAIGGREYWLHLETHGDPANPVLLVLPGGPGADFRLLRPLRALADRYFLVMWDQHGAGLSERASHAGDLSLDTFDEEIAAIQTMFAPGRKVTLIGHSFGGAIATRFAARHPDDVQRLILIEPGPLTQYARDHRPGGWVGFSVEILETFFWDNEVITAQNHEQADFRILGILRPATEGYYCGGQEPEEYPIWRFGAYEFGVVVGEEHGLDYAAGIGAYTSRILVVAGTCGELGADFQREFNLPALPSPDFESIEGAGHLTLFLEHAAQTVEAIRSYLERKP
jgi:pimeloyl-ACP methyl ester carboxylesterase